MKTNKFLSAFFALILLFIGTLSLKSQESASAASAPAKSLAVYPSIGLGIGFFYPSDVNDYIETEIVGGSVSTNTDLYMYLEVKGGVTFRLKKADISAMLEYDIAPKYVTVSGGGDDFTYSFGRFSPELSANYYFPGKSGRNAFFVGAGINYSFMKFEDFSASAPGFKIQLGYSMQFGKFNLQPYGAFRYTKATDSSDAVWGDMDQNSEIALDYIGGQIGVIMSFHKRMSYK